MSTRLPNFVPDIQNWQSQESETVDEFAEILAEEQLHRLWLSAAEKKDCDISHIGADKNRFCPSSAPDEDSDDESDDSNEQMGDDMNVLPDSPDEQIIPDVDTDDNITEDNSNWVGNN